MPKLTLQFEGRLLREYTVGVGLTIGRLPDNAVVIDNPAVSGHHARVYSESGAVILEDLDSTNGTYVNGKHANRYVMRHGDVVLIGKHQLVFDNTAEWAATPSPALPTLGDTMYLDTKQHRELRATLEETRMKAGPRPVPKAPVVTPRRIGVLQVIAGRAEQTEYDLDAHTTLVGKSENALVRLHGWFKPQVALAIARSNDGYVATRMGGRTTINNEVLEQRQALQDGDVLNVNGLVLEFRWKDVVTESAA
jgi:pSer/pThr/pTyr-binding forkhead associated (FHA) protein